MHLRTPTVHRSRQAMARGPHHHNTALRLHVEVHRQEDTPTVGEAGAEVGTRIRIDRGREREVGALGAGLDL